MDGQRLFVEYLSTIDRVVNAVARRHRLSAQERDELHSLVRLRLIEHDYAALRAFEHRSSLATYLTVVITRVFLDERNHAWGRWRPSAHAQRLGPVAVLLDQLLTRDGYRLDEAIAILRTNHRVELSDEQLRRMWASLPERPHATLVAVEAADDVAAPDTVPVGVEFSGRASERVRIGEAIRVAMARLSARERLIIRLSFQYGFSLAALAEQLGESKATMKRRVVRILADFRHALGAAGLQWEDIRELLSHGAHWLPDVFDAPDETRDGRVRLKDQDD